MSDVLVGATLPQFTDDPERFVDGVRRAEEVGLDSIWLFDHLWPLSGKKERPFIECWTALAWIAAATERIRIGTLVTRSSLRHPALLGKMAATVAAIAPGRVTIAVGSGDDASRAENEAFGIEYLAGPERIEQLISAVGAVRSYLHQETVTIDDGVLSLTDLPTSPRVDAPRLWVGGRSDDVLEVAGRVADGWNGWGGTPTRFAQDAASVVHYAGEREIELSWGGQIMLGANDADARDRFGDRDPKGWVVGGPDRVAERLRAFVDAGARHVIATFPDPSREGVYEMLAERVRPGLT